MQDLRVIGVQSGALLVSTDAGGEYRLPVTHTLHSQLRAASPADAPVERKAPPREIQALVRAGRTAAQIAELTGADVDYVHRFEGPVLAERAFVLDAARRAELLARSARGDWIGSIALSEPTAGSDLAGVQTRAVREGDTWVLTGTKRWAGFAKAADFVEVLARTRDPEPGEPRSAGLEPFLVVKEPGTFPPGMTGRVIDKIGYHGFLTFELDLDGVRVPESDRLTGLYGDQGADADSGGFASVQRGLNIARVHTAARAVGVARAAMEDTQAYLQEREQFGHPIGDFQALRFALADMAAEVAQARAFWCQVAHLLDQGEAAESESAMVKLLATEMAVRVTNQAMQLHGGNGYTTEWRVERYWRDARLTTIFEGTSEIQRRIISDRMLPKA